MQSWLQQALHPLHPNPELAFYLGNLELGPGGWGVTRVQANADANGHIRHVAHAEGAHSAKDVQCHVGNLCCVPLPIPLGQPGGHHIGVPNCLHLRKRVVQIQY